MATIKGDTTHFCALSRQIYAILVWIQIVKKILNMNIWVLDELGLIDGAQIPKMVYQLWNYLADYGGSQIILMSSGFDLFPFYNSGTNQELLSRGFISGDKNIGLLGLQSIT